MPMRSKPSRWVLVGSVSIAVVPVPGGQPGLDRVLPADQSYFSSWRAMTMRWIWLVPS